MKKTGVILLGCLMMAACRKKVPETVSVERFRCVCNTSITFVDHCGEAESKSDTSFVESAQRKDAETFCKSHEHQTVSSTTISTKTCELK